LRNLSCNISLRWSACICCKSLEYGAYAVTHVRRAMCGEPTRCFAFPSLPDSVCAPASLPHQTPAPSSWFVLSPRCRRAALECECRFLPCSADFCTNLQKTLLRKIKHRHPPLYYTKPPRCPRPLAGVRSPRKRNRKTPPLAFCIVLGTR
jgi:hypothetical protein